MPIAIAPEHEELRRTLRRWTETHCPREVPRSYLDAETEKLPPFWEDVAEQGWLGLHVPEESGGHGFGFLELAVVIEELAHAIAPGPFLPTALAAAVVAAGSDAGRRKQMLGSIVDGTAPAAVALAGSGEVRATRSGEGSFELRGSLSPVLGAGVARVVILPFRTEGAGGSGGGRPASGGSTSGRSDEQWCLMSVDTDGVSVDPVSSLDATRRVGSVVLDHATVLQDDLIDGVDSARVQDIALALFSAECAGGARWCLEVARDHALVRKQFGRPIGQFQAVKHRLADMLVLVEQATSMAWDAAAALDAGDAAQSSLAARLGASLGLDAYVECAKGCIQLLGGMGFTWEHDAHMHLRRSLSVRQLAGGTSPLRVDAARSAISGTRRSLSLELPPEAEGVRRDLAPLVSEISEVHGPERRKRLAETGLLAPHWPKPWGRGAGPVEQLVIDQELAAARINRPNLAVGAWALPTIIAHGTQEQQERFVGPTLAGDLVWCQLFSEPGAGSDLAALSTRAIRDDGGWVLEGQKVWTSMATKADWGICLARTNPEAEKHEGITYFLVHMRSEGIDVRPLREITGQAMFNEVFLNAVFVPDDCVVGEVNGGWRLARTTLANERVSMSSGTTFGFSLEWILGGLRGTEVADDAALLDQIGALMAEAQSLSLMGARTTLRSVSGVDPGPEASIRKLLGGEHEQRLQELGLGLLGPQGSTTEGEAERWSQGFLSTRCLTIAGGTSEVQRNVIAERLLGLPRDPEPAS